MTPGVIVVPGGFVIMVAVEGKMVEVGMSVALDTCVSEEHDGAIPDPDPLMSILQTGNKQKKKAYSLE